MAITLKHTRPVTDDELLELSRQNPGYQFERSAKGELIVTPTGMESGRASGEVVGQLRDWNQSDRPGVVFDSSTGFGMPDGSVLSPDASWVRRDRWDALTIEDRNKFGPFCPDAVFEIRSESNTLAELHDKMRAYLANGARVGVLVDPDRRTVEVYRPGREPEMHQDPKAVSLDPELAGFILNLESVFTA